MQVFSPVSLVFAMHMIKTWNYKTEPEPQFLLKYWQKPTTNPKMETVTALSMFQLKAEWIREFQYNKPLQ